MTTPTERLRQLQDEAYTAVIKVLVTQETMTFKTDLMLTKLRETLVVTDERHRSVLEHCLQDSEEPPAPAPPPPLAHLIKPLPAPAARNPPTHSGSHARGTKRAHSHAQPARSYDSLSTADASVAVGGKETDLESKRSKKHKKMALLSGPTMDASSLVDPLVGNKVSRYWPEHGGWFEAVITDYRPTTKQHCLTYDFGTPKEMFEWYSVHNAPEDECKILDEKVGLAAMLNKSRAVQSSQFLKSSRGRGRGGRGGRGGGGSKFVHV